MKRSAMRFNFLLSLEFLLIFVALPVFAALVDIRIAVFGALWGASFLGAYYLWRHEGAFWTKRAGDARGYRGTLITLAATAPFLTLCAWHFLPDRFFSFPMERPQTWALVMILYPFLSALPQEILYRGFLLKRYAPLFPTDRRRIAASAIAFSLAHLVFMNWIALALSLLGGALFAWRYARTQSLRAVILEHALYGNLIFTIGLGWYFYLGAR